MLYQVNPLQATILWGILWGTLKHTLWEDTPMLTDTAIKNAKIQDK
jgi:hypothetical protein